MIEPLLFFGLVTFWAANPNPDGSRPGAYRLLIPAFLAGGAFAGLIGILQFGGLNLAPLIGQKVGFSDDSILVEGVRRVSSLYGHPNNFGLYMGRIWPIAAVLALATWRRPDRRFAAALLILVSLLSIGGLLVSFSRGAYLGALVAAAVIAAALLPAGWWRSRRVLVASGLIAGLGIIGVALILILDIERFNPFGASSAIRIQTWISALAMLRDHPLGIGLDQFGQLYPQYINPALAGTNEINTAHPHNLILDIALRMGPLGLIAFGWLIWQQMYGRSNRQADHGEHISHSVRLLRYSSPPLRLGILAALAAALTHGLVDAFYFWPDLAFAFWLFVALADDPPE
ncbi:MAG: hypothetical protein HC822_17595 [Oscillochloris sp.]|nr:hypothetical protein [Oscillochloris sp.]